MEWRTSWLRILSGLSEAAALGAGGVVFMTVHCEPSPIALKIHHAGLIAGLRGGNYFLHPENDLKQYIRWCSDRRATIDDCLSNPEHFLHTKFPRCLKLVSRRSPNPIMPSAPPRGVYAPVTVFFHEDSSLDTAALRTHIIRLGKSGLKGLVISGSNGEAVHLSRQERIDVIRLARATLDGEGLESTTIIAGCGTHSTKETVQLCKDAAGAGAAIALVLPPNYWAGAMNKFVLLKFFSDVSHHCGCRDISIHAC